MDQVEAAVRENDFFACPTQDLDEGTKFRESFDLIEHEKI
jgi:hypothetical protein